MRAALAPLICALALFGCASPPAERACAFVADGAFTEPFWSAARWISLADGVRLAVVETRGETCIGVDTRNAGLRYVDLFVLDAEGGLHNLHASMQVGERRLPAGGAWTDRDPATEWGRTGDWRVNTVAYREGAREDEPLAQALAAYEGYEFAIAHARMPRPWRVRLEARDFEGARADVVWPAESTRETPSNWSTLQ